MNSFQDKLNELCDISTSDNYQTLRSSRRKNWKTDWAFFENQKVLELKTLVLLTEMTIPSKFKVRNANDFNYEIKDNV